MDGETINSDTDDENVNSSPESPITEKSREEDKRRKIGRRVVRKWMRLAGLQSDSAQMVEENEHEWVVSWTKGILPKLEGRIVKIEDED